MVRLSEIDLSIFTELQADLGDDFVNEMATSFIDDSIEQATILKNALTDYHQADFIRAAHNLKSTSLIFGARNFGELARELEQLGREGFLEGSDQKVKCLFDSLPELHATLKGLCHG